MTSSISRAALACILLLLPWTRANASGQDLTQAETNLQQGRVDAALADATAAIAQNPKDPAPHFLVCRARYHLDQWPAAADACRQAIALDGQDARYHLWLGRALGEQAERASLLTAYSLARQLRVEFETAARLSPRNADVLSDLGEFYAEAPGILGGGADKARAIAAQLGQVDPVASHWLQAEIARSHKDYDLAEREFRLAIETSPTPAQAWMNLASFYRDRKRLDEMETAAKAGAAADAQSTSALVDGANTLLRANRNTPLAIDLLQRYLRGGHLSEDAPAFAVHTRLAQALELQGDTAGAAKERLAAHALAQEYVEPPAARH